MKIPFLSLKELNKPYETRIKDAINRVVDSGWYLLGQEVNSFENEFSKFVGVKHTVGVANGLDALRIILRAYVELGVMEEGDEIIVPANTYIASVLAITDNNLKPVFVEPDIETYNIDPELIEKNISSRTKGIMIVHLYGRNAYTESIGQLCKKYQLKLLEDAAQAHGAYFKDKRVGSLGDAAGFSFYPGKNLGALGDAGGICTDDDETAEVCRTLSNYGSQKKYYNKYQGYNSRLDEIHATILRIKLKGLDKDNQRRRIAAEYLNKSINNPGIILPRVSDGILEFKGHVWHLFVIRTAKREELITYLQEKGIGTLIHYPLPPNKQLAYPEFNQFSFPITDKIHKEVLSLPLSPVIKQTELNHIVKTINSFS